MNYNVFLLALNYFEKWLRVWGMDVSREYENNNDLLAFGRETKVKFTDLVEYEIMKLKNVKVSFGLEVKFLIERNGETEYMKHYFQEKELHVFNKHDEKLIKQEFERFIEKAKGEIQAWSVKGSGWVFEKIMVVYVNVGRYQPLRGGTYLPLPANLAKKAIINVLTETTTA